MIEFGINARTHGLILGIQEPYYIVLLGSNPIKAKKHVERLLASIRASSLVKALIAVFHTGYCGPKTGKKSPLKTVIRSLAWIREKVESHRIRGVYP